MTSIQILASYFFVGVLAFVATLVACDKNGPLGETPIVVFFLWPLFLFFLIAATIGKWAAWALSEAK